MLQTLDRTRPFGEVYPIMTDGSAYAQDDMMFDRDGNRVLQSGEKMEPEETRPAKVKKAETGRKPPWRRRTKTPQPTEKKRRKVYPSERGGEAAPAEAFKPEAASVADTVNLREWALGSHKQLFGDVSAAILEKFSAKVMDEPSALRVLHEKGVINDAEYDQRS